jgi:2-polyprenyl-3-methyl-5-hydroxy-6-metoxy-1,4-benzoquinol methylase
VGSVVPQPTEEELKHYYEDEFEDSYVEGGLDYVGGRDRVPDHLAARIEELCRVRTSGKLLEIGAGTGAFLNECKTKGWEVTGTELGTKNAAFAKSQFGLDLLHSDIIALGLPNESFDVIHINHVLEHLVDPPKYLAEFNRLLKRGGLLIVEVPNEFRDLVYILRGLLGVDQTYKVPTPHLFFFSPRSLCRAIETSGFQISRVRTPRRFSEKDGTLRLVTKSCVSFVERLIYRGPVIEVWCEKPG